MRAVESDPRGTPGPDDPLELVGVALPAQRADLEEMARCLIEEYALLGYPPKRILLFFRSPFYAGSYHLTQVLGAETIDTMIAAVFGEEA